MLAIRQSAGTIPEESDWLKIYVRIFADSAQVSFRMRGEISSGPRDFLQFKPDSNLMTPFLVTSKFGISGCMEGSIAGMVATSSLVKIEEK